MDRVVTYRCLQLHLRVLNLSRAKINLAFGTGNVTRERELAQPPTFLALHSARRQQKMGKHTASENTFRATSKLVSFKLPNFSWTSMLPHTHTYTHIQIVDRRVVCCYVLFSSHTYTHAHTAHMYKTFSLLLAGRVGYAVSLGSVVKCESWSVETAWRDWWISLTVTSCSYTRASAGRPLGSNPSWRG